MGKIHHINVVRLLGYCAKGIHRALVYNFFPNDSLQSIIFPPDDKQDFLGWEKLQNIALGIAIQLKEPSEPEVFSRNFGNVSYKSDIYSYRILLDMSSPQDFHVLYPDWMHDLVHGDVHIHVEDDGDVKIAEKLAIVGLWCIQWLPLNCPSIKSVIQMLESKEEDLLIVPPNPFHSSTSTISSGFTSTRRPLELEVIQE
ncbi:hypothetical protein JHK86_048298 [Glycine max]|nr:hypothetical protein JHK86_048298 [Glycine max]